MENMFITVAVLNKVILRKKFNSKKEKSHKSVNKKSEATACKSN